MYGKMKTGCYTAYLPKGTESFVFSVCCNILLLFLCSYTYGIYRRNRKIYEKNTQHLKNEILELKVEKYRCYKEIVDSVELAMGTKEKYSAMESTIANLREENEILVKKVEALESYKERIQSLRKGDMISEIERLKEDNNKKRRLVSELKKLT